MLWEELARALCLVLIIEGILPFLYPERWRKLVASIAEVSNKTLRLMGLLCMLSGVAFLFILK